MRIMIPLVVEMTDEQVADYAAGEGLPHDGGKLMARHVVEDLRRNVLHIVQESFAADVSIKR